MKRVLITGITGQDGSYLAELYLKDNYEVHGIVRRTSITARPRIDHLFKYDLTPEEQGLKLHYADLNDMSAILRVIEEVQPRIIINLAAQSHVGVSFRTPIETTAVTGTGALAIFEAVRILDPSIRVYQAGSSEMYGGMLGRTILNETSTFYPKSPYAAAKVFAHNLSVIYRDSYGMFISNGILFNHESPRRGENFVSRKISLAAARISLGLQRSLKLGNMESKRDWGHAEDYCRAIKMIMDADSPQDYVVATSRMYSVKEFLAAAFGELNLDWQEFVKFDSHLLRPNEVDDLIGDPSKIAQVLGWMPKISFEELVKEMVSYDVEKVKMEKS